MTVRPTPNEDARWMRAALALAQRGLGRTWPSPAVGCIIVSDGRVIGRGETRPGGRPHAECVALEQAGAGARGATAYCTLEPCAHVSVRGPTCSTLLIESGIARVVTAMDDPDPRTAGQGHARLAAAGVAVERGVCQAEAEALNAGFLMRLANLRPWVTLKLAVSLDGSIALGDGRSQWITGARARHHAHLERSRHDAILVGRGTAEADDPSLDVRLAGLEDRAPLPFILSARPAGPAPGSKLAARGARVLAHLSPHGALRQLAHEGITRLMVEGGAGVATSFIAADLVDRLLLYRAPVLLGGQPSLGDLGLPDLAAAQGRWSQAGRITLGVDVAEVYTRIRTE